MKNLLNPFWPLIWQQQQQELSDKAKTCAVARGREGRPEPFTPLRLTATHQDTRNNRIAEIERCYDSAWPMKRSAAWLGAHHARNAADLAEGFARGWGWNCHHGGWPDQADAVRDMVAGLRNRVDPALHAAAREFDPTGHLNRKYNALESDLLDRIDEIGRTYKANRADSSSSRRKKLRQQQDQELQMVLDDLAVGVRGWADSYPGARFN